MLRKWAVISMVANSGLSVRFHVASYIMGRHTDPNRAQTLPINK